MAIEAIKMVTQTEQDSQKRRDTAAAEGKQAVSEAQKAARRLQEETRQEAEAQARQMMRKAEEEAARQAQQVMEQAARESEQMKEEARTRLDAAVERIVEKVVKG